MHSTTRNNDEINAAETVQGFAGGQKLLNRYKLSRVLGQGGMGVVWLARDEELDRDVALKFLPAIVVNDRASLNDLKRETRRSLELTHPNIVRTYDFVQDDTVAGISMEYVECDTLRNRRVDQPSGVFEPEQLGSWTQQLCAALDYAHMEAGIVHRDLKPANLMINGRNQLKVADFGISRSLVESVTQISMQGGVSGTLVYMSPQQLAGEPSSPLDDVYAVGATLYELITTKPPFYTGDIAGQVHTKVPQSLGERRASFGIAAANIPQNWETTISACLAKDPSQRPRSAGEIAVRLGLSEAASLTRATAVDLPAVPPPSQPPVTPVAPPAPMPMSGTTMMPQQQLLETGTQVLVTTRGSKSVAVIVCTLLAGVALLAGGAWYWHDSQAKTEASRLKQEAEARLLAAEKQRVEEQAAARLAEEKRRQEAERLANARGNLLVKTEPLQALVKVDDAAPIKNPIMFRDLKLGKHQVEITLEGYDPVTLTAEVKENQPADLGTITLNRSKGALQILTTPANLPYELKSKDNPLLSTRGVTPLTATAMLTGDYEIIVKRDGWREQRRTVTVTKDQEQRAVFEFPAGSVMINSEPVGATVKAGGKELGVTPLPLSDLPPGVVEYTVSLAGYETAKLAGTVQEGNELTLQAPLQKAVAASKPRSSNVARNNNSSASRGRVVRERSDDYDDDRGSSGSTWDKASRAMGLFQRARGF